MNASRDHHPHHVVIIGGGFAGLYAAKSLGVAPVRTTLVDKRNFHTVEDAIELRRRVLLAFEAAERETNPERRQALLTFVVVGGGATGVELSGALGELAHDTLRNDFRSINPAEAKILLLEGGDRILAGYPPELTCSSRDGSRPPWSHCSDSLSSN